MKNAGWLYYRNYYNNIGKGKLDLGKYIETGKFSSDKEDELFSSESKAMLEFEWNSSYNKIFFHDSIHNFSLETMYPGLIAGIGYGHQTGTMGEFKFGFYFDHTTGLPAIPGSSVKGILRSAFPALEKKPVLKENKKKFILGLIGKENLDVSKLEEAIFVGKTGETFLPIHERDVFHDAFIVATKNPGLRKSNNLAVNDKIFFDDYITPHGDPLKNPVPVRFLKIGPGVKFQFNFSLKDSGNLSASEKLELFRAILLTFGAGAKTNVGYGQFVDSDL